MNMNPLTNPLAQFHSTFTSVLDQLPENGKILEITKRIMIVVVAPFAYLALGFLSLVGRIYDYIYIDKNITKPTGNIPDVNILPAKLLEDMNQLKESILHEINRSIATNKIKSMKALFNIKLNDRIFNKDYIIKKADNTEFDNEFLTQRIDLIITELKETIEDNDTELSITWNVLIKNKNETFLRVEGWFQAGPFSTRDTSGSSGNMSPDHFEQAFARVLERIGRQVTPQLNDQLEFLQ